MTRGQVSAVGKEEREPDARPVVECQDVSRVFSRGGVTVPAVRSVSCAVWAGDRVALTGPSGSGKSTLLHLLAGLVRPTAGTVSWPPDGWRPGRIGVVFQVPSLMPDLDAVENVALPLLLAGTTESDALVTARAALDLLAIGELATALPETLSAGQAQRVAIARVLVGRPRLILADEPTGRLDHETGGQVVSVLLDTAAAVGAGLVVTTHDPQVAARLTTTWNMRDGELSEEETA